MFLHIVVRSHDITVVTLIVLGALVRLYSISLTFSTFLRTSVCLYRTISLVFFTFFPYVGSFVQYLSYLLSVSPYVSSFNLYSICLIFSTFLHTLVCLYSICLIFSTFLRTLVRLICTVFILSSRRFSIR